MNNWKKSIIELWNIRLKANLSALFFTEKLEFGSRRMLQEKNAHGSFWNCRWVQLHQRQTFQKYYEIFLFFFCVLSHKQYIILYDVYGLIIATYWNVVDKELWTGATDKCKESQFNWCYKDDEISPVDTSFLNFDPNEPSNDGGPENCLQITNVHNMTISDTSCSTVLPYLCEVWRDSIYYSIFFFQKLIHKTDNKSN